MGTARARARQRGVPFPTPKPRETTVEILRRFAQEADLNEDESSGVLRAADHLESLEKK